MTITHLTIFLEGVIAFKSNLKLTKENHLPFKSFKFKNPLKYTVLRKSTVYCFNSIFKYKIWKISKIRRDKVIGRDIFKLISNSFIFSFTCSCSWWNSLLNNTQLLGLISISIEAYLESRKNSKGFKILHKISLILFCTWSTSEWISLLEQTIKN